MHDETPDEMEARFLRDARHADWEDAAAAREQDRERRDQSRSDTGSLIKLARSAIARARRERSL